jgi:hypothetical protein
MLGDRRLTDLDAKLEQLAIASTGENPRGAGLPILD